MRAEERIIGCLLGGAIGDAFGGPYEGAVQPVALSAAAPWRLSDDTQLTLATCEGIEAAGGGVRPEAIAARLGRWFEERRITGIGASTFQALSALARGGEWALVGARGEMAAGNGAAMRIAPLAFLLDPDDARDRQVIRDVARITHHNDEAYAGAFAVVLAVRMAWLGEWRGDRTLLTRVAARLPDARVRDHLRRFAEMGDDVPLAELAGQYGSSGYVVESVPLALLGAQRLEPSGFRGMLEALIRCGGDTDTLGSIAGQVAGTVLGRPGLDPELLGRLPEGGLILQAAERFAAVVTRGRGT